MKTRFSLSIEKGLLEKIKVYSTHKQISLSQIIENHFELLLKFSTKRQNIVDMLELLAPSPRQIVEDSSRKELFYEDQKKKYGF